MINSERLFERIRYSSINVINRSIENSSLLIDHLPTEIFIKSYLSSGSNCILMILQIGFIVF